MPRVNRHGSWSGVAVATKAPPGHRVAYQAGCECGALFRGRTKAGRDRFRERHQECRDESCPCCGREVY